VGPSVEKVLDEHFDVLGCLILVDDLAVIVASDEFLQLRIGVDGSNSEADIPDVLVLHTFNGVFSDQLNWRILALPSLLGLLQQIGLELL
jgi:hypothetical protein